MIFVQVNKSKMHKPIYNCNFLAIYDPQPCLMTLNYRYPDILPAFRVDKFIKSSSVNITISYSLKFLGSCFNGHLLGLGGSSHGFNCTTFLFNLIISIMGKFAITL